MLRRYLTLLLLSALTALGASLLVTVFHNLINASQLWLLDTADDFSHHSALEALLLPFIAIALLLLLGRVLHLQQHRLGIPLVIQHMRLGDGSLPWRNTLHQFIGGYLALSVGFAVGREGPIVHLGAAAGAALGFRQHFSPRQMRKLAASGVAAAVTLIFSTPLASISLVMEVLLGRWRLNWLPPLAVAALVATLLQQWLPTGGNDIELWLDVAHHPLLVKAQSPWLWPLLFLFGLLCGGFGILFNRLLLATVSLSKNHKAAQRFMLVALLTALLGLLLPYTLGTLGSVYSLHNTSPSLWLLLAALLGKLLLIVSALGLGIPGGVIGPLYALGLLLGLCLAAVLRSFGVETTGEILALYGLAAVSAAVLQAPVTSLLTVLELSGEPMLMPGALFVVLPAWALQRRFFQGQSIFVAQLASQGLRLAAGPSQKR